LELSKLFYSPTDARVNCLKNSINTYIKNKIKMAPTCFGAVTPSSGSALFVLAKVTKHHNTLPDDGVTAPKHVGAVSMTILNLFFKTNHLSISW
jgi:hypothetical protein